MSEDAGAEVLQRMRAARLSGTWLGASLLVFFLVTGILVLGGAESRPDAPSRREWWNLITATTLITALGTFAAGFATISNLALAWRAERRQAQEFDSKLRQLALRVQQLEAKNPEKGPDA